MSKLASLSFLAVLAVTGFALPTAPAQAQACPVGAAACLPPPPPPPPPGNNPGDPGDPYIPPDTATEVVKKMLIACRIAGTPKATPDDLKFRNIGETTIPAATRVYWTIKETGEHGTFALPADLPAGEAVSDQGVLKAGLPTSDHCFSKIM